ncbi:dihydroorotase [Rhodophyticola sp. CCM32]|uniref:dihydroorotase n=1 Tax=Rhodophyticola sp. CCM32 TaxID=2916397 RepID=UPI00107F9760|nr:amidohydrolase family protein [Rhodophyticola sp. CCM32]QBY00081.1 dihydroorotase [Rhodophyticola sp. CCM32]
MYDRIIKGRIVTDADILNDGWVAVTDGRIAEIGQGTAAQARETVDHGTDYILPGVVDGQTHATSCQGLKGIEETTQGALAGGVTTLVDMPYDNPLPLDRPERFDAKAEAIATHAHADMALYGTLTTETGTGQLQALRARGVVAFKISSFESSPTRFPRIPADLMLDLMEALAPTDLPIGLHNEDQEIVLARMVAARAAGEDGIEAHARARPLAAELAATGHFMALGEAAGAHVHPVHLTAQAGFDLVASFTARGARATGELCVHYLALDAAEDGARLGARMKVNPPIRAGAIDGLWRAVTGGKVALISSDHSSWPIDNKLTASIFDAGAGVPGVETLLPLFWTLAERRGLDAPRLCATMLSDRPAQFFGIDHAKGRIAVGREADLAVLETGSFPFEASRAHDGLRWSPFDGDIFDARVVATYLRGAMAWDGSKIVNAPGDGRLVKRMTGGWFAPTGGT